MKLTDVPVVALLALGCVDGAKDSDTIAPMAPPPMTLPPMDYTLPTGDTAPTTTTTSLSPPPPSDPVVRKSTE